MKPEGGGAPRRRRLGDARPPALDEAGLAGEPAPLAAPGRPVAAVGLRARLGAVARLRTPARHVGADRLAQALSAQRPKAFAAALLLAILGFSLDDLRVLRVPGYLAGAAAALVVLVAGPLLSARRFALDHAGDAASAFAARCASARRIGALGLLATCLLGVAWLAFFSSGVPPWAR